MSKLKSNLEREFKQKKISAMSKENQAIYRQNSLKQITEEIGNKKNRYIFYCPDIAVVNPLVKIVYEIAYEAQQAGYNVIVLHEISGFKAKWLYESEGYEKFKSIKTESIINKVSSKSKREKNNYSFKPSDTIIVTDAFQEMLENLLNEKSLTLVQKIVLVTGYMGLKSLNPGMNYRKLDVSSLIFFDQSVKDDYESVFGASKSYMISDYPVLGYSTKKERNLRNVYPVIAVSCVGNNDYAQQLINTFYNKYPNLSMFTFKIIARDNLDIYYENISTSAAFVFLDKDVVTKQMIFEVVSLGVPIFAPARRELMDDKNIVENFVFDSDFFVLADTIATYCNDWLGVTNSLVNESVKSIVSKLDISDRNKEAFGNTVSAIFAELQGEREFRFNGLLNSLNKENAGN